MRGKRSKQYRKLMQQYAMTFGFREPYQVLVDAQMVLDGARCKMDLVAGLQRTLHGAVKPMITQCEMRRIYASKTLPEGEGALSLAQSFERRRCGHHPEEFSEPLPTQECMQSVVDPKSTGQNKHRYVVACQSQEVRRRLRMVHGVPLIYVQRSVMILEPMADESVQLRAREERSKFRAELKKTISKRKSTEPGGSISKGKDDGGSKSLDETLPAQSGQSGDNKAKKKRKSFGPKQPNPLAVKRAKKQTQDGSKPREKALAAAG